MEKKTSVTSNALIWFGAGISMSEILTGTYFASLGFQKGILAIGIGHVIGCVLLYLSGLIGAKTRRNAMETVKISFGKRGNIPFAFLNVLQLIGWLAILNYDGAKAANEIFGIGSYYWCGIIGILLLIWVFVGLEKLEKINKLAMTGLFLLTICLCVGLFMGNGLNNILGQKLGDASSTLSFGAAVELAVAMPLSWIPVISDYTSKSEKPVKAAGISTIVYGLVSSWMYIIGMAAVLGTGSTDIGKIAMKAGFGVVGILIIVFSTVTTNYLAAYSAGISSETMGASMGRQWNAKWISIGVVLIGSFCAVLYPMDNIEGFLYLINSVFSPMIAIMIADFFLLKKEETVENWNKISFILWGLGFILYRYLLKVDMPFGPTAVSIVITIFMTVLVKKGYCSLQYSSQH